MVAGSVAACDEVWEEAFCQTTQEKATDVLEEHSSEKKGLRCARFVVGR